jgi:hypothetical protein
MAGPLGRLRNVVLNALVERVFARPHKRYQQVRLQLGFAPSDAFFLDGTAATAPIYLQGTIPESSTRVGICRRTSISSVPSCRRRPAVRHRQPGGTSWTALVP